MNKIIYWIPAIGLIAEVFAEGEYWVKAAPNYSWWGLYQTATTIAIGILIFRLVS